MMYKGGKNHIKPTDFLNFYTSEKGGRGVLEIKGNIKVRRSTVIRLRESKYFFLMVCVFEKSTCDENQRYTRQKSR